MNKLVSIILPTYNGADRINESIKSVLNQTYTNWELLVIDDGSKDNTKDVVENFTKNDPRIRYIKNENNLGIQKTLNKGIREAKGEYIARIDDDDIWCVPSKLEKQVEFLDKNSSFVLVGTGIISVDTKGLEQIRLFPPLSDLEIRNHIVSHNCFFHSSVVFVREVALRLGGYSEFVGAKHAEDYDFWLRLGAEGKFANLPLYAVTLVNRDSSISASNRRIQAWRSLTFGFKYFKYYPYAFKQLFIASCKFVFLIIYPLLPIPRGTFHKIKKFIKGSKSR